MKFQRIFYCAMTMIFAMTLQSCQDSDEDNIYADKYEPYPQMVDFDKTLQTAGAGGETIMIPFNDGATSNFWFATGNDLLNSGDNLEGIVAMFDGSTYHSTTPAVGVYLASDAIDRLSAGDLLNSMLTTGIDAETIRTLRDKGVMIASPQYTDDNAASDLTLSFVYNDWATITIPPADASRRWVQVCMEANNTGAERTLCLCFYGFNGFTPWQGQLQEINNIIRISQPAL